MMTNRFGTAARRRIDLPRVWSLDDLDHCRHHVGMHLGALPPNVIVEVHVEPSSWGPQPDIVHLLAELPNAITFVGSDETASQWADALSRERARTRKRGPHSAR